MKNKFDLSEIPPELQDLVKTAMEKVESTQKKVDKVHEINNMSPLERLGMSREQRKRIMENVLVSEDIVASLYSAQLNNLLDNDKLQKAMNAIVKPRKRQTVDDLNRKKKRQFFKRNKDLRKYKK